MKHPINSILSFPQDIKQDILYVMIIVFQYQSIGQVGLLIVIMAGSKAYNSSFK